MMSIVPSRMRGIVSGSASTSAAWKCLRTTVAGTPLRRSTSAVPAVARISKPRSCKRLTGKIIERLSRFATDTKAVPLVGNPPA